MPEFYDIYTIKGDWLGVRRRLSDAQEHALAEGAGTGSWIVRRQSRGATRAQWVLKRNRRWAETTVKGR